MNKGMKIISSLSSDYGQKDVCDFLDSLDDAIQRLEVLGQIQATVGSMAMQSLANGTFDNMAYLQNVLEELRASLD